LGIWHRLLLILKIAIYHAEEFGHYSTFDWSPQNKEPIDNEIFV
jgi:hypothetical protein